MADRQELAQFLFGVGHLFTLDLQLSLQRTNESRDRLACVAFSTGCPVPLLVGFNQVFHGVVVGGLQGHVDHTHVVHGADVKVELAAYPSDAGLGQGLGGQLFLALSRGGRVFKQLRVRVSQTLGQQLVSVQGLINHDAGQLGEPDLPPAGANVFRKYQGLGKACPCLASRGVEGNKPGLRKRVKGQRTDFLICQLQAGAAQRPEPTVRGLVHEIGTAAHPHGGHVGAAGGVQQILDRLAERRHGVLEQGVDAHLLHHDDGRRAAGVNQGRRDFVATYRD